MHEVLLYLVRMSIYVLGAYISLKKAYPKLAIAFGVLAFNITLATFAGPTLFHRLFLGLISSFFLILHVADIQDRRALRKTLHKVPDVSAKIKSLSKNHVKNPQNKNHTKANVGVSR